MENFLADLAQNYPEYFKEYFPSALIIAGAIILSAAFLAIHKMICQLPKGKVRLSWSVLRVLIFLLISAYASFTVVSLNGRFMEVNSISYYVVPLTYFLCACIVYLVISFVLDSAIYVRQFATGELENITDPQLGIHNRRYLEHRLLQEVQRAQRYKLPLSALLLNLDFYHKIADQYGRQIADGILASFAKLVLNTARSTDIVARYEEDKIMIVATNTPVAAIPVFAYRLRKMVTETILLPKEDVADFKNGKKLELVTVSIGVAGISAEIRTMETLEKSAEDALTQAQAKGPSMVVINKSDD
jgi:diguanylate cyclase (GGDEF)-like protein